MKYSANLIIDENPDDIIKLFKSEEKEFQNERAFYTLNKKGLKAEFIVKAKDATAFRAVLNSIVKNLVVFEKVKNE